MKPRQFADIRHDNHLTSTYGVNLAKGQGAAEESIESDNGPTRNAGAWVETVQIDNR